MIARDSRRAWTQEPQPVVPALRFGGVMISGKNGRWVLHGGKTLRNLSRGESFEG
jgi:hypothetical protein